MIYWFSHVLYLLLLLLFGGGGGLLTRAAHMDGFYLHTTKACQQGLVFNPKSSFFIVPGPEVLPGTECPNQTLIYQGQQLPSVGMSRRDRDVPFYRNIPSGDACLIVETLFSMQSATAIGEYFILKSDAFVLSYVVDQSTNTGCVVRYMRIFRDEPYLDARQDMTIFHLNWGWRTIGQLGPIRVWVQLGSQDNPPPPILCIQPVQGSALCREVLDTPATPAGVSATPVGGGIISTMFSVSWYRSCDEPLPEGDIYMKTLIQGARTDYAIQMNPTQPLYELTYNNTGRRFTPLSTDLVVPDWNIESNPAETTYVSEWQFLNGPLVSGGVSMTDYARDVCYRIWDTGDGRFILPVHRSVFGNNSRIYNSKQELIGTWGEITSQDGGGTMTPQLIPDGPKNVNVWFGTCPDDGNPPPNVAGLDPSAYIAKKTSMNCSETHFIGCMVEVFGGAEYEETPVEDLQFNTYLTGPRMTMDLDERPIVNETKFQLINANLISGKLVTSSDEFYPNTTDACISLWDDGSERRILSLQDATYSFYLKDSTQIYDSAQTLIGNWDTVRKGKSKNSLLVGAQPGVFLWSHHGLSSCREWSSNYFNDMGPGLNSVDGKLTTRTCDSFGYIGCLVEILDPGNFRIYSETLTPT